MPLLVLTTENVKIVEDQPYKYSNPLCAFCQSSVLYVHRSIVKEISLTVHTHPPSCRGVEDEEEEEDDRDAVTALYSDAIMLLCFGTNLSTCARSLSPS